MASYDRQLCTHFHFWIWVSSIDQGLEIIKTKIFDDCSLPVYAQPDWAIQLEHALECYNFAEELGDEDDNPHNINIPKSEETHEVDGPKLEIPAVTEPIKIKKINIGIEIEPSLHLLETIGMMKQ